MGVLATAPDYRVIYVQVKPEGKVCAEPPADAAGQIAATFASTFSGPLKDKTMSAEAQANFALSMKQLFLRSQGIQFYRDGISALCNMYVNGVISDDQYLKEAQELRAIAKELIQAELPAIKELKFDQSAPPSVPAASTSSKPANSVNSETPAKEASSSK